jgi:hypothetical protein
MCVFNYYYHSVNSTGMALAERAVNPNSAGVYIQR